MSLRISLLAALGSLVMGGAAHAVTITAVSASSLAAAPFTLGDFGTAGINGLVSTAPIAFANGIVSFAASSSSAPAGLYDGNVPNVVAAPLGNGNYLAAEPGSDVTLSFDAPQTQFQLLWGSVDTFNSLTFTQTNGSSLTITGADISALDQSAGPAYVTISGLHPFKKVVASSTSPAFEFLPNVAVPEPGTLALVGLGLGSLVWLRRRRAS